MMIEWSKHVGAFLKVLMLTVYVCAFVGVPIKWLCEVHGATIKMIVFCFMYSDCVFDYAKLINNMPFPQHFLVYPSVIAQWSIIAYTLTPTTACPGFKVNTVKNLQIVRRMKSQNRIHNGILQGHCICSVSPCRQRRVAL